MASESVSPELVTDSKIPAERFIPYCQHFIDDKEIQEIVDTLRSNWLTAGPKTVEFEKRFAEYVGARHAIALNSCTAGLHLALVASGVEDGDEVITTPFTFCATAEVIEYQRAKPIFVDIDSNTFNLNPAGIEDKITPRTKAILPVHYGGIPCELDAIYDIARRHNLTVIEDAAHAVGSVYQSKKIGGFGNPTVFSFYPTKNMTTGEGGIVVTDDSDLADRMRMLALHGMSRDAWKRYSAQGQWYYEIHELGYKYNFTDLQAALGLQQLSKLDQFNATREKYAKRYFEALQDIPEVRMPNWYHRYFDDLIKKGYVSPWHLFVMMIEPDKLRIDRGQFIEELRARGIGTSVHFIPLHLQPYYANKYGFKRGLFPNAEAIYDGIISLPLYPKLKDDDLSYIIDCIKDVTARSRR